MSTQNTNRRLRPDAIAQGTIALNGLRGIPDYQPIRLEATVEVLQQSQAAMLKAQELEVQLKAQSRAAADAARQAEWQFHNAVLAMKTSVLAQYGDDSNQAEAIGLKKKSAYKRPSRRGKTDAALIEA